MKGSEDSPKTPGGISKSLLTPCRRVGLSRNWGKKGATPFISPLTEGNSSSEDVKEKKLSKKRKICTSDDEESPQNINELISTPELHIRNSSKNINNTPVRNVQFSKKKSKTLIMQEKKEKQGCVDNNINTLSTAPCEDSKLDDIIVVSQLTEPVGLSKSISKQIKREILQGNVKIEKKTTEKHENNNTPSEAVDKDVREKSPNNLTKECIVVIQKKMIKNMGLDNKLNEDKSIQQSKCASQTIFDSDDETPLCELSKQENIDTKRNKEKDSFTDTKVKKLKDKNTSTTGLKNIKPKTTPILDTHMSQNSFDDDDDFECFNKRTILIKKSYDKVVRPNKAKSTGSITQKDIDELKARIEMKKKQLLVKAISEDTSELRHLIKKWQKGCQEALFELFDLMRKKFPDKRNMDYSEILQTLKIPPDLVGYDVENDCFVTPDDASVILSSINT